MKHYLLPALATATCLTAFVASAADLTIPQKKYTAVLSFTNAPARSNEVYPLSDQSNHGGWVLSQELSDEFNGKALNTNKWFPNNPRWQGRPPTFFDAVNVSVTNGEAVFSINKHGAKKLPKGFTDTSGFIVSRQNVLYGYFEAEMKLMNAPWVSGFWMSNSQRNWWTEIDICENCPGVPANRHDLNSNVHVFRSPPDQGDVKKHFALAKKYRVPFELQADWHVWGLEWDKDNIRFYLDGILFRMQTNTHWHQPLQINLNNESNEWFGALPDHNTNEVFRVRYFRAWEKASAD